MPGSRKTLTWLAIPALVLLGAAACDQPSSPGAESAGKQIRGRVLEVVARDFTEVETLRLLGDDDQEYRFTTEGFTGFTASHLREHQLFGQPVVVSYVKKDGQLVAVNITD